MGRKPKNPYENTSIAWVKDSEFRMFYVKVPKWLEVDIGIFVNGEYHGTEPNIVSVDDINGEEFAGKIKKQGCKVLSVNHYTIKIPSICLQCEKEGTPKIEPKNTDDYRATTGRYQIPKSSFRDGIPKTPRKKPQELHLSYSHGSKKKHWLWEYVPFPQPHFKAGKKKIDLRNLMPVNRILWLKRHFEEQ